MSNNGFFRNTVNAFISARERQADRYISEALLRFDDATLKNHGYSRAELTRRAGPRF